MRKRIYLHIGLPKTGSTFLQKNIFPKLKLNFIENKWDVAKEIIKIPTKDLTEEDLKKIREILRKKASHERNLISNEGFTGDPYFIYKKSRKEIFKDLKSIFSGYDIRVILVLREQTSIITSYYKQYVHGGGTEELEEYLDIKKSKDFKDTLRFRHFDFHSLLKEVFQRFGKKNVLISTFERFKTDKAGFLENICMFLEEKVPRYQDKIINKGYGPTQIKIARYMNRFFKTRVNKKGIIPVFYLPIIGETAPKLILRNRITDLFPSEKFKMPNEVIQIIKEAYTEKNIMINKEYGLKLPKEYINKERIK